MCFCLFVKLRLSLGRVGTRDKYIPDYRNCGKIRVPSRRCTEVPVASPGGGKNTNSRFLRFSVCSVPLFHSLMLTPMPLLVDNPRRSRRLQPTAPPEESGRTSRLYPDLTAHDTEIHPEQGTLSREDLRRRRLERFA